ncbi:hypothetical protein ACFLVN_02430 [Chloroflexota bacterium]
MNNGYFNIKRDNELIATGTHFYCYACLTARPIDDISPDERYCQGCCEFLLKEASLDKNPKKAQWVPDIPSQTGSRKLVEAKSDALNDGGYMEVPPRIMSTSDEENITVDIIKPSITKRGRKPMELPLEFIAQLYQEGLGSKAIATRLSKEQGIRISYKTIQRLLKGARGANATT